MTTKHEINAAIDESVLRDKIVDIHLDKKNRKLRYIFDTLTKNSSGSAETSDLFYNPVFEFWGTTQYGDHWRIHLIVEN